MKKIIAALLAVIMLLTLVGCKKDEQPTAPVAPDNAPVSAQLHTAVTSELTDRKFATVYTFGTDEYESYMFWNDVPMTNVGLIGLEYDADYNNIIGYELLCKWDSVASGDALQLNIMIPEGMPNSAFSFTTQGNSCTYILGYNGRDGGISLMPCDYLDPTALPANTSAPTTGLPLPQQTHPVTTTAADNQGIMFTIYLIDDNAENILCREMTIESRSAWHAWAALKQLNPCIPIKASLKSFTINGKVGTLDLSKDILSANVGSSVEVLMLQSIANTYIENYGIEELYITIDGGVYESGHLILDYPLTYEEV